MGFLADVAGPRPACWRPDRMILADPPRAARTPAGHSRRMQGGFATVEGYRPALAALERGQGCDTKARRSTHRVRDIRRANRSKPDH